MNMLRHLPKTSVNLYRHKAIVIANERTLNASYSICCTQRSMQPKSSLRPTSLNIQPKRHKSFTEIFQQLYMNVSHSTTVSYFQNGLISFNEFTGLPWWATIIISTIGLRIVTFPLAIYVQKMKNLLQNIIQIELPAMNEELKKEVAVATKQFNLNERESFFLYKKSFNTQYRKMIERDNCHPLKTTLLFWFQIPIWVCFSIGIRNILTMQPDPSSITAMIVYTQMETGGFLWIPNLIEVDASYILPVLWCLTNLANIELNALEKTGPPTKFSTGVTAVFRVIVIAIVPLAASVPSCLTLYWCSSALCAMAQNLVLLSPKVRQLCGIPINPMHHMEQPYQTLAHRFQNKMEQRKHWCLSFIKSK